MSLNLQGGQTKEKCAVLILMTNCSYSNANYWIAVWLEQF